MTERKQGNEETIESFRADNVRISYNPEIEVAGKKTLQSLTIDFHASRGWVRIRLEGDMCGLFNQRYNEHTSGRLNK